MAVEAGGDVEGLTACVEDFEAAMCDDMNTPRAVAALFALINLIEKAQRSGSLTPAMATSLLAVVDRMDAVLGLVYEVPVAYFGATAGAEAVDTPIPEEIYDLARKRASFKASKMFADADKVRRAS